MWTIPLSFTREGDGGMGIGLCGLWSARDNWDIEAAGSPVASSMTPSMLVDGPLWCDLYSWWSWREKPAVSDSRFKVSRRGCSEEDVIVHSLGGGSGGAGGPFLPTTVI